MINVTKEKTNKGKTKAKQTENKFKHKLDAVIRQ